MGGGEGERENMNAENLKVKIEKEKWKVFGIKKRKMTNYIYASMKPKTLLHKVIHNNWPIPLISLRFYWNTRDHMYCIMS